MADGNRFVVERRLVYGSSCYGSFTVLRTKLLKNVGSGGGREVGGCLTLSLLVLGSLAVSVILHVLLY